MANNGKIAKTLKIHMPEQLKSGVYSNIASVSISKNEVLIDFIFRSPTEANLVSRVILPITHAESLEKVLSNLLKKAKEKQS